MHLLMPYSLVSDRALQNRCRSGRLCGITWINLFFFHNGAMANLLYSPVVDIRICMCLPHHNGSIYSCEAIFVSGFAIRVEQGVTARHRREEHEALYVMYYKSLPS